MPVEVGRERSTTFSGAPGERIGETPPRVLNDRDPLAHSQPGQEMTHRAAGFLSSAATPQNMKYRTTGVNHSAFAGLGRAHRRLVGSTRPMPEKDLTA